MINIEEYSYSKLTRFEDCPLSYMRKYLDEEVPDSHGITECGLFMHHILEEYEKGNMQLDELVPYYEENFDKQVVSTMRLQMSETFSKDMYGLYYNDCLEYLKNFTGIPNCKTIVDVEKEFHLPYNDYSITGKIDLIFRDNDNKLIVLDHKSKKKFKSKKDQAHYARQLYLYAWACKSLYGTYPDVLMFNMLRGEPIYIEFDADSMQEALDWFDDTVKQIRNAITFDANVGTFYCNAFCLLGRCELCE